MFRLKSVGRNAQRDNHKNYIRCFTLLLLMCLVFTASALATDITFEDESVELTGGGFGNSGTILALQQPTGQVTTEFGSVFWTGTQDMRTDNATNQSQTRTAGEIVAEGVDDTNFAIVFNINESNEPTVRLDEFSLLFMDENGNDLFSATFDDGPLVLDEAPGQGSAGWLFRVNFMDNDWVNFISDLDNRVGMEVTMERQIEMVSDGPDSFVYGAFDFDGNGNGGPGEPPGGGAMVPEPSGMLLAGAGLLFLISFGAFRRKQWVRRRA